MTDLKSRVAAVSPWYHTFEFPDGTVTTAHYDLRTVPAKLPLPASLTGKRVLDAASSDGFWAFEMARRGAEQVISLDLDDPSQKDWQGVHDDDTLHAGTGDIVRRFEVARDAFGFDNVKRVDMNLYDITPESLGTFDFVFIGSVLLHLSDPARALRAIRSVLRPGGELFSFEAISLTLSALSPKLPLGQLWDTDEQNPTRWWTPNMAGHRRIVTAAGFDVVGHGGPVFQPFGSSIPSRPASWKELRHPRMALFWLSVRRFGAASQWVRATPRPC